MRLIATAGALALALFLPFGPAIAANGVTWSADPGHSAAEFTVQHLVFTHVRGLIKLVDASIVVPQGAHIPTSVDATLDATSINTENPDRDKDLRGPDWLDVTHYPNIQFKSTSVVPGDGDNFQVVGDLTIHGVTKPVTLAAHFDGQGQDARGNPRVAFSATTKIDRRDFGLLWAHQTPGGSLIAGNDVDITLSIEAANR